MDVIHLKRSFVGTVSLTPFSYVILVLVGEGGAGPHDLVRMMRQGAWAFWASSQSQYYAEPKRLARLGLLSAERAPGRTHDRTVYRLTDEGRRALAEWLATPAAFPRGQKEAAVRLLGAGVGGPAAVLAGLRGVRGGGGVRGSRAGVRGGARAPRGERGGGRMARRGRGARARGPAPGARAGDQP